MLSFFENKQVVQFLKKKKGEKLPKNLSPMQRFVSIFVSVSVAALPAERRIGFVASTNGGSSSFQPLADVLLEHASSWSHAHAYCSSPGEITNSTVLPSPPFCYKNFTEPIKERAPFIRHVPIIQMLGDSGPLNFQHPYIFAEKYVAWAETWGFDGYLLDAEFKGDDAAFAAFLNVFADGLHAVNKTLGVFLYPDLGKKDVVNHTRADYWLGTWGGHCSTISSFIWACNPYWGRGGMMLYQTDAKCSSSGIDTMFSTWGESRMEETSFWANAADMGGEWYDAMEKFLNRTNSSVSSSGGLQPQLPTRRAPQPLWNYSGFLRFPSFYFGANPAGPQSPEELAYVRRNALVGWGWQQGFNANGGKHGEAEGASAATALRKGAPRGSAGAPDALFVYRQSENLFTYYDDMAFVASDATLLAAATLHDPVSGRACGSGGLLAFSNETFVQYWAEVVGGNISAREVDVDGVFLDGFDKLYAGNTLSEQGCPGFTPALTAAALLAKVNATAVQARVLNAARKVPIISTYNFFKQAAVDLPESELALGPLFNMNGVYEDDYVAGLEGLQWMRFYEVWLGHGAAQDAVMISNAILEAQHGVPFIARTETGSVHTLEYPAIGFLIAQSEGSYWGASSGWLDPNWKWVGIDDWDVGAPVAPAQRTGTYTWERAFAKANATIDVHAGRASLTLTATGETIVGARRAAAKVPLPETSWATVPLFAHVRWANFSAKDISGLGNFRSVTVQVEPDAPLKCEAQAADVQRRLQAAASQTVTLQYGNVFFAEPNCAYFDAVAENPWIWLNDSSGKPYRPADRFTFDLRAQGASAWWSAHVIVGAGVSGGFGDSGCGDQPAWLNASAKAAFAASQRETHAVATASVANATGGLYVANCPIVPEIGDNPIPGVQGEMIESWCSDFAPGYKGPANFCRDELVEAVVLASAVNRTWLQARYYLNAKNDFNPQFGLAAFLVAASEGSFFGASRDWDWAGDWENLLAWPWATRPLGSPAGPPTMTDKTGCAWSRVFQNATATVNLCTTHLFARIEWGPGLPLPHPPSWQLDDLTLPPLTNVNVEEASSRDGSCPTGAARVIAPWAAHGNACLSWKVQRAGQLRKNGDT